MGHTTQLPASSGHDVPLVFGLCCARLSASREGLLNTCFMLSGLRMSSVGRCPIIRIKLIKSVCTQFYLYWVSDCYGLANWLKF